jgi:hypothetical protein
MKKLNKNEVKFVVLMFTLGIIGFVSAVLGFKEYSFDHAMVDGVLYLSGYSEINLGLLVFTLVIMMIMVLLSIFAFLEVEE